MTNTFNNPSMAYGVMLRGAAGFILSLKIIWIFLAALMALGVAITLYAGEIRFVELGSTTVLMSVGYCLVVYALIHIIGAIVKSVRKGDPFTAENAQRLRKLGWMFLMTGIAIWIGDAIESAQIIQEASQIGKSTAFMTGFAEGVSRTTDYSIYIAGFVHLLLNPALILASPLMFILARVFDAGIAMREDAEGII